MALRAASRRAQRGAALLAMVAIVVMGVSYMLVDRLGAANRSVVAERERNARVLNQAKQALIGYVAQQAATAGENNPGRLPCPEAGAYYGDPAQEGIASPNCTLPAVGRLPWRTLGLEKLVDADAEPLWYVVSPGWALPSAGATLTINSDSVGQLAVDGAANDSIALIIAPGAAMAAQAGTGCTAWVQTRPTSGAPDLRNYLECDNATSPANATFVTGAPGRTFNDQVLRVTAADLIPSLEAAIAHRMQREIVPALRGVYGSTQWNTSAANPLFPFAAPFGNPGTSNYRGVDGNYQGLLPFSSSDPACGADPRCSTTFVSWNTGVWPTVSETGGWIVWSSCGFPNSSTVRCSGVYGSYGTVTLRMTARANNVAKALRQLSPANISVRYGLAALGPSQPGSAATGDFNTNGSADLVLMAQVPGLLSGGLPLDVMFEITADLGVLADHSLLDPADATTGWFVRNEWYRLTYYAAAAANTADGLGAFGCSTAVDCLRFENPGMTENKRALLVLAGRSINGTARPSSTLANYLEFGNNDNGTRYEQNPVSRVVNAALKAPFNDRVMIVDSN